MSKLPPGPQSPTLNSSFDSLIDNHENDEWNKNKQNFESNVLPRVFYFLKPTDWMKLFYCF